MAQPSLESIYSNHRQALFSLALTITGCPSLAEDAIHQAFIRLGKQNLKRPRDLVSYVFQSVRNSAIDQSRARRQQHSLKETIFNGFVPPPANSLDDPPLNVLTRERDQVLRQAIDELPDITREAVILKTFSELTFEQIGVVLGMPTKTVATRYHRALKTLQLKLRGRL